MGSRARNKLNTKQVASFSEVGLYSDGGGLYLRVRTSGRSWFFVGTIKGSGKAKGKRLEIGLGSAMDVTLAKAREKAEIARQACLEGRDPRVNQEGPVETKKAVVTFGSFATQYIADIEGGFRNRKHAKQWSSTINTYAESILQTPIDEVSTDHVLAVLQPIWKVKRETATRVRGRVERVLDAAKAKGLRSGENPARWRGHLDLFLTKRSKRAVRHHPALPFAELSEFMGKLGSMAGIAARALEFTILTAARSGEVRGMTWGEVNLPAKVWTVPATRMKASAEHQVPLSEPAIAILEATATRADQPGDFVFVAPRGGALSDMALLQVLRRMGRNDITVHGFRSTFRDWAGETTEFGREEIEMALAHTIATSTERAYRRGRALEKRRELMAAWASFCQSPTTVPT